MLALPHNLSQPVRISALVSSITVAKPRSRLRNFPSRPRLRQEPPENSAIYLRSWKRKITSRNRSVDPRQRANNRTRPNE